MPQTDSGRGVEGRDLVYGSVHRVRYLQFLLISTVHFHSTISIPNPVFYTMEDLTQEILRHCETLWVGTPDDKVKEN